MTVGDLLGWASRHAPEIQFILAMATLSALVSWILCRRLDDEMKELDRLMDRRDAIEDEIIAQRDAMYAALRSIRDSTRLRVADVDGKAVRVVTLDESEWAALEAAMERPKTAVFREERERVKS